jgi:hypothetical protein
MQTSILHSPGLTPGNFCVMNRFIQSRIWEEVKSQN